MASGYLKHTVSRSQIFDKSEKCVVCLPMYEILTVRDYDN